MGQVQRQQQHRRLQPAGGGGGGGTTAPRGKFKPPARLNTGPPLPLPPPPPPPRHHPPEQPESLSQQQPGNQHRGGSPHPRPLLPSPSPAALARAGQQPSIERRNRQQPFLANRNSTLASHSLLPAAPPPPPPQLMPARRKTFIAPSKTTPSPRPPQSSINDGAVVPLPLPAGSKESGDRAMPPFRLTLGGDRTRRHQSSGPPLSSPCHHRKQGEEEEQGQRQVSQAPAGSAAGKRGRSWPVRTVWVPNGFEDAVAYRGVFCRAMQV